MIGDEIYTPKKKLMKLKKSPKKYLKDDSKLDINKLAVKNYTKGEYQDNLDLDDIKSK